MLIHELGIADWLIALVGFPSLLAALIIIPRDLIQEYIRKVERDEKRQNEEYPE